MSITLGLGLAGMKPGVVTSSTRPIAPYDGQVIVESNTDRMWLWTGAAWSMISGRVPGVRARMTTTYSIASGSNNVVAWATEDYDTDVMHDNVTNNSRLTCPAGLGGLWHVGYSQYVAPGTQAFASWFTVNGGATRFAFGQVLNDSVNGVSIVGSDFVGLVPGYYVEQVVFQNGVGARNVGHTTLASFWAYRIGPS